MNAAAPIAAAAPVDAVAKSVYGVALAAGDLTVLRHCWGKCKPRPEEVSKLVLHGHHAALIEAYQVAPSVFRNAGRAYCSIAAEYGHLEILQWLLVVGCPVDEDTCPIAARSGHIAVLQWARKNHMSWDNFTCEQAAAGGHLEVVVFLVGYGYPYSAEVVFAAAVKFGWLEDIQYRILHGYLRSAPDFAEALNAYPELRQGGTDVCHVTRLHPVV